MIKRLFLASILWASCLAALAGNPGADFIAAHPGVNGVDSNGRVSFAPGATADQISMANADAAAVTDWTITKSDPAGAEKAILLDTAITPQGKLSVSRYKSVLETYARDPQSAQLEWQEVIIPGENISTEDVALVEQHCADFKMPLR